MRGLAAEAVSAGQLSGHVVDRLSARMEVRLDHVHMEDVAMEVIAVMTLPHQALRVLQAQLQVQPMALLRQPCLVHQPSYHLPPLSHQPPLVPFFTVYPKTAPKHLPMAKFTISVVA